MGDKPGDTPASAPTVQARRGRGNAEHAHAADPLAATSPAPEPRAAAAPDGSAPPRYQLATEIARGGMGRVVEATDTLLGRTVAVKEALSAHPEALRRFQRETRITALLEHPSIVPVHDAGVSETGRPFYVMRKVSGRPLEELVSRADRLDRRLGLVQHVVAAAQAIAHAHERGVVHRDIKPSNILVGELGETVVIDWGIAKVIGEPDDVGAPTDRAPADSLQTRTDLVLGTPGFIAPEQLRGTPADERSDVYALGATLYYVLARQVPHHDLRHDDVAAAALEGPPTPVAELVAGVPPELATIVDKALAYDAARRYQNAGALAEDLQRFLTGQLVASHYYTPREKLARFVDKHRAAVATAACGFLAVLVVAGVLVQRIRNERDRADEQARLARHEQRIAEQQREAVLAKSDELVLVNARHLAASDPTRAVAWVKPLADGPLWRAARDVAAAASVHGVAFSLPASPRTTTLELSRDGTAVLAAGDDGIVRIHDLAKRDTREIANTRGLVHARFGDGERKVVLYQGNRMTIVELSTGTSRDVTAPTAIARLAVSGPIVYWVDPAGAVWKLDLAGDEPTKLALGEAVTAVTPSPDGRWIALAGTEHLLLVDRASRALPPEIVTSGAAKHVAWSADSAHLVAVIGDDIVDVGVVPSPQVRRRTFVGTRFSALHSGGRIFSAGPSGLGVVDPPSTRVLGPRFTLGVHESRDHVVVAAKPHGEIVVLSDRGDRTLRSPAPIAQLATSPRGPWIVAAADHRLLVWNLDAIVPRRFPVRSPSSVRFVTGDRAIVTYFDQPAEWLDLRNRARAPLGAMSAIEHVAAAPSGEEAIAIGQARRAWRVPRVGRPQELAGEISAAVYVDDHRLVLAGPGGLRLEDLRTRTELALYAHEPAARTLVATAADGGWIAAAFEDGRLWRKHLATGAAGELLLDTPAHASLAITDNGTVVFGAAEQLRAWRSDGNVDALATLAGPVVELSLVDRDRVLVLDETGASIVRLDRGAATASALPVLGKTAALSRTGALVAARTGTGDDAGVEVIDPVVDWRWTLATPIPGQPFTSVAIAPDGSHVLATTKTEVLVWALDLPADGDATRAWLDRMSNATSDNPFGPLGWEMP